MTTPKTFGPDMSKPSARLNDFYNRCPSFSPEARAHDRARLSAEIMQADQAQYDDDLGDAHNDHWDGAA